MGVYVIAAATGGPVKVGSTTSPTPERRLGQIQACSPLPLVVLAWWPELDATDERALHRDLAQWRSHGEWFWPSTEVLGALGLHNRAREHDPYRVGYDKGHRDAELDFEIQRSRLRLVGRGAA